MTGPFEPVVEKLVEALALIDNIDPVQVWGDMERFAATWSRITTEPQFNDWTSLHVPFTTAAVQYLTGMISVAVTQPH